MAKTTWAKLMEKLTDGIEKKTIKKKDLKKFLEEIESKSSAKTPATSLQG